MSELKGWQPLASAPLDGTPVLLDIQSNDERLTALASYGAGWHCYAIRRHRPVMFMPTEIYGWMPLPEPPQ